jgi:pentatricopeptide repeat protein
MCALSLEPTVTTYTTLIGASAKSGQITRAEFWMARMVDQGVKPNVVSFAAVIDACAKSGDPTRAVHWHEQMVSLGVLPNSHIYASVISAFAHVGDASSAEAWLERSERDENCDSGDVVVYSSVISACAKAGDADRALEVYQRMRSNGIRPHIVAYAALARPFAYKGDWHQVELIAADMAADRVATNEYFIYAQLLAYATARPRQELRAEACFREAAARGVRLNDHIQSALTRAVGKPRCAELMNEAQWGGHRAQFALPQRGGLAVRREPREALKR